MNLLITGGAGFIGANFVHYWLENHPKDQITVLDSLTYAGHLENLEDVKNKICFVKGDICDWEVVKQTMDGIDCVVHFAAESHVDRSLSGIDGARRFYETNLIGTQTLLQGAKDAGVGRFLLVSTDEVFGDLDFGDPEKFNEKRPYNPHSPYAVSKAAADMATRAFYHTWGEPEVLITNCTNNLGPYQTPEKMIPRSIALLMSGQKLKLYTDAEGRPGRNVRDWLYVEDHCSALEAVLSKGEPGETYCIGGDSELSNYELVEKMLKVMAEITGETMTIDTHVELVNDRPGHDRCYAMDASKIKRELGWKPKYDFERAFKATVDWYTSPEGKLWLESLNETTHEVREGQDRAKERK